MSEVRLDLAELTRIATRLKVSVKKVGKSLAFDVEGLGKKLCAYETGAMMNSYYTVTQDDDGFSKAQSDSLAKRPDVELDQFPTPSGDTIAHVGPSVEYAEAVELGTSEQAAHPSLIPAVEQVSKKLNDGGTWKELFE
jgi:hypothetical protein